LSAEVVELVNSSFNFYHTQTYFIHPTENELVLEAATGEAGKAMLEKGHRIPMGRGLVGRAAETNTPVLVSDVSADREWLPNPLLPETKSELAIPISAGEIVIGVLDVQQNIPQGLTEEHKDVLQTVANQIMIAAQNARLLMEAQRHADREALITTINQKIQNTTTVENALQVAVREVGLALGAHASVRLAQLDQRTDNK
jgi:putative methionine-R-sulfoxide reductase with GAF domain